MVIENVCVYIENGISDMDTWRIFISIDVVLFLSVKIKEMNKTKVPLPHCNIIFGLK